MRVFFVNRSTVLGAAILAGGALGLFNWDLTKPETLAKVNRLDVKVFSPTIDEQEREWKYSGWTRAVDRARGWKSELSGSCPYICHRDRLADAFPLSSQPTPVMAKATIRPNENAGRPDFFYFSPPSSLSHSLPYTDPLLHNLPPPAVAQSLFPLHALRLLPPRDLSVTSSFPLYLFVP